jgi:hypothetical protein
MLENDIFDHTGVDSSEPLDRVVDAGFVLEGTWAVGENIGWQSIRGEAGLSDDVIQVHEGLMNSPSHRDAILNPMFTEIGIGIEEGEFFADGREWDSVMVTQNFGLTGADDIDPVAPEEETVVTPEDIATVEDTDEEETAVTPEEIAAVEDPDEPEDITPDEEEETVATTEAADPDTPLEVAADDTTQDLTDDAGDFVVTGFDWDAFDWGNWVNLDFNDGPFSGSGNNNGNGNTGGGLNGQGNGFGNTGTGVNGTGNGNGNSDWWNDLFEVPETTSETDLAGNADDAATDWSWGETDVASLLDIPEPTLAFDDCFVM